MKKAILIGVGVVIILALLVAFGLPYLQPRCQRWYHRVDFLTDKRFEEQFGRRPNRSDYLDRGDLIDGLRNEVIEEIGAKPFYCN